MKNFRVITGPVGKLEQCRSVSEFCEKVPAASEDLVREVEVFFATHPTTVLEVVPLALRCQPPI